MTEPIKFSTEIGGKNIEVKIDNLAEQANGSVSVQIGDTLVMATATMSTQDLEDLNFFPLTVDFEEKFYAAGKILGSRFMRREGRPSEEAILTARLIDRTIRPLFPTHLKRKVQVIISCFSFDEENDPDVAGLLATSLALGISDIPWNGPIAPIRINEINNELVLNPTYEQRKGQGLEIIFTGVENENEVLINMMEAQADQIGEKKVLEAIKLGKDSLKKLIDFQKEIISKVGKQKISTEAESFPEIDKKINDLFGEKLETALMESSSAENKNQLHELTDEIINLVEENFGEEKISYAKNFIEEKLTDIFHKNIIEKEKRPDNRKIDEIREIDSSNAILPRVHGSAVFIRGKTKALSVVTLGSPGDERLTEGMEFRGKKRFMHHYNFPPYCSGEVKPLRSPGRREIGHGLLAEKALLPLIPNSENFPYTIRIVTEILSSNGSSSMASVCAASLALMDAGVPVKKPAAGIAIGLAKEVKDYKILTDIQGPEDHFGDMDFKVAGTTEGITAIQMDVKIKGIDMEIIEQVLSRAKTAREHILNITQKSLAEPKESLSPFAPRIFRVKINPDKIGTVIGPGGKMINEIIDTCGVTIDIEDDGSVFVGSEKADSAQKAIEWIESITKEVEVGQLYQGKVVKILEFGAFVEILPGKDGLVHISELDFKRVEKVEDVLKVGDVIPVKVISVDGQGKISLSKKQAEKK
ncbi:MAG: polyribonucleotide nucleotidyltransferase [Patescibacteria group bacterium]|nr:polyribonucleotide nucleotidyltransferase [Patescibacteria group bacterium]